MEVDEENDGNRPKKNKRTKTARRKLDDTDLITSSKKRSFKGIMLSVMSPHYVLCKGIGRVIRSLRWEHRNKLLYLLRQLVRRQNWNEASGVLSVLLKGTHREHSFSTNRIKYWATLELLQRMGIASAKPRKILHAYEMWMKKDSAVTKNSRSMKGRFVVQLEFIVFCISRGDTDGAYQAVISLLQENEFRSEPVASLVAGVAFYHLWYTSIQKELNLTDLRESGTPVQLGTIGSKHSMSIDKSDGQGAVEVQESESPFQGNSDTSVRIDKEIYPEAAIDQNREAPMEVDDDLQREVPEHQESHMNTIESDQSGKSSSFPHTGNKLYASIFYAHDLEPLLMPLRLTPTNKFEDFISLQRIIHNDHYKAAVKHLQSALHSSSPLFEALLPLIQMLLLGDQVKEAVEEVESIAQNSDAVLPLRLKASLLEHFSRDDNVELWTCFEDTLKKDPTCMHSLTKLICMHHDGCYNIEKLLEMIALHLDATFADSNIWREFASCFIRLAQCEDDRMSSCMDSYDNGYKKICGKRSKEIPEIFKDNVSRKNWKLRCRWWLTRHFSQTMLASEVASGKLELVTYKAASACHLYGPEFVYVVKALAYLDELKKREMLSIIRMHMQSSIGLYKQIDSLQGKRFITKT